MKRLQLHELVERRTFRARRHARLLASDETFKKVKVSADDEGFPRLMKLHDLQLLYRSTDDEPERTQIASAFAKLANEDDHFGHVGLLSGLTWKYEKATDECMLRVASAGYVRPDIKRRAGRRVSL